MSLSTRVLLGLVLGVIVGVFFGDLVAFLDVVGDGFVLLLQMTVLPYVVVSLIAGLGSLNAAEARTLARYAGVFLLVLWGISLLVVALVPFTFPDWESASFFSRTLVTQPGEFDFLSLYIPANPFYSAAAGVVPAMVVFSVALGLALMGVERKRTLLESLQALEVSLLNLTGYVVGLAPYGVFAISAQAAGTMDLEQLRGLQVYTVAYAVTALVLALWTLPTLLTALTPFRYREVLGATRDALVTAFATGNVFVVLPILAGRSKDLLESRTEASDETRRLVDVVVPISFSLSTAGKLLALCFIPFAGWLSGFPLSYAQYPGFIVTGTFSFFASTLTAVPFLLDLYRIPADTFELFVIADNVVGARFGSLLAAVHIVVMALAASCAAAGLMTFRWRRLLFRWALPSAAVMLVTLGGVRAAFELQERPYEGYELFMGRSLLLDPAAASETSVPPERGLEGADDRPALQRIQAHGVLRVGYSEDRLPFVFRNHAGELVGLDVEMMHVLAHDLESRVEFVRIDWGRADRLLDGGVVDIVIGGWAVTPQRLQRIGFSAPYLDSSLAFIVRDHRREEFNSRDRVKALTPLRLGVPKGAYLSAKVQEYLPQAEIVLLDSPRQFFTERGEQIDALVYSAEAGSAWTLVYPEYSVAVPHPDSLASPMGFPVARGDRELVDFVSAWIGLKQKDQTISRLFAYWIEGESPADKRRRWCVIRDVLGWVE